MRARLTGVAVLVVIGGCGGSPKEPSLAALAAKDRHELHRGDRVGTLSVPRFHATVPVSAGIDQATVNRGPGWHLGSFLPGERRLTYIAGHRRTHGAPFFWIGRLRRGDRIIF